MHLRVSDPGFQPLSSAWLAALALAASYLPAGGGGVEGGGRTGSLWNEWGVAAAGAGLVAASAGAYVFLYLSLAAQITGGARGHRESPNPRLTAHEAPAVAWVSFACTFEDCSAGDDTTSTVPPVSAHMNAPQARIYTLCCFELHTRRYALDALASRATRS